MYVYIFQHPFCRIFMHWQFAIFFSIRSLPVLATEKRRAQAAGRRRISLQQAKKHKFLTTPRPGYTLEDKRSIVKANRMTARTNFSK
jgi:hypothetical protein